MSQCNYDKCDYDIKNSRSENRDSNNDEYDHKLEFRKCVQNIKIALIQKISIIHAIQALVLLLNVDHFRNHPLMIIMFMIQNLYIFPIEGAVEVNYVIRHKKPVLNRMRWENVLVFTK